MDQPQNIWLLKRMHLDKQHYKNQNAKNLPHSAITTAVTMLYLHSNKPNVAILIHERILKNQQDHIFV